MHADRTNHTALTLLGVLLLVVGCGALAASLGGFGDPFAHHALLQNAVGRYVGDHGRWLRPAVGLGCLLVALAALRWLITVLLSTDRASDIRLPGDRRTGATTVEPAALATALSTEIESYRGVKAAKARVLGDGSALRLAVTVAVSHSADLAALRQRIEADALTHARHAMDQPQLPIRLDLTISRDGRDRVI